MDNLAVDTLPSSASVAEASEALAYTHATPVGCPIGVETDTMPRVLRKMTERA